MKQQSKLTAEGYTTLDFRKKVKNYAKKIKKPIMSVKKVIKENIDIDIEKQLQQAKAECRQFKDKKLQEEEKYAKQWKEKLKKYKKQKSKKIIKKQKDNSREQISNIIKEFKYNTWKKNKMEEIKKEIQDYFKKKERRKEILKKYLHIKEIKELENEMADIEKKIEKLSDTEVYYIDSIDSKKREQFYDDKNKFNTYLKIREKIKQLKEKMKTLSHKSILKQSQYIIKYKKQNKDKELNINNLYQNLPIIKMQNLVSRYSTFTKNKIEEGIEKK